MSGLAWNRRTFLKGVAAFTLSPLTRVWAEEEAIDVHTFVLGTVKENFGYLRIDQAGLEAFADDLQIMWAKSIHHRRQAARNPHEFVLERFLLSSDFFQNHADESKLVRYLGIYEPYLRLCQNPIAKFEELPRRH